MAVITALGLECIQISRGSLGFPADNRALVTARVNAQTYLTPFRSEFRSGRKIIHGGVVENAFSFLFKKINFNSFSQAISYLRVKMFDLTRKPMGW